MKKRIYIFYIHKLLSKYLISIHFISNSILFIFSIYMHIIKTPLVKNGASKQPTCLFFLKYENKRNAYTHYSNNYICPPNKLILTSKIISGTQNYTLSSVILIHIIIIPNFEKVFLSFF